MTKMTREAVHKKYGKDHVTAALEIIVNRGIEKGMTQIFWNDLITRLYGQKYAERFELLFRTKVEAAVELDRALDGKT